MNHKEKKEEISGIYQMYLNALKYRREQLKKKLEFAMCLGARMGDIRSIRADIGWCTRRLSQSKEE